MTVTEISSYDDFKTIINGSDPVVIDFTATWCGPCRIISPIFEKFSEQAEFTGVKFYKIDVDQQEQVTQEVGVRAMPTFMLFQNGNKVKDLVGANPQALQQLVTSAQGLIAA